ncbi:MAG: hypothetical protein ABL921_34050, partial [Pirellula sp.]
FRFYLNAATDAAIADRFANGSEVGNDPHLVVTFDDGTARDFSTYRNNGTMEGGNTVDGRFGKAIQFTARAGAAGNATARNRNAAPAATAPSAAPGAATADNAAQAPAAQNAARRAAANQQQAGNSFVKPKWTSDVPIYVRAMVLSGNKLFIAGPLDIIDEEETFKLLSERDSEVQALLAKQDGAIDGKMSGLLLAVNCDSGEVENQLDLGSLPAWDGMAGASGRLYLSTIDGQLMCFGK